MKKELKPCPFCGCTAEEIYESPDWGFEINYHHCDDCPVSGHNDQYETAEEAVEAWNTRPIEDALRAENARLLEALKEICGTGRRYGDYRDTEVMFDLAEQALKGGE